MPALQTHPPRATARLLAALLTAALLLWATPRDAWSQEDAAAAPTGIVRVTSPLPGATVYVDDEPAGDAPAVRYLPAGTHTVRVAVDNYEPFVRRVEVIAGTSLEVAAELIPGTGTVEFLVKPNGAKVSLNGGEEVPTPVRLRDLKEGEYSYRITAAGHETETGTFTFRRGRNLLIADRLKSTAGLVEVVSSPEGARVWLDGQSIGATPLSLEGVALGPHTVRVELQGYATAFRSFDTTDGSKGKVDLSLPTQGAMLSVVTGHPSGTVAIQGDVVGTGQVVRLKALERGSYELMVTVPDQHPAEDKVVVPPRGRITLRAKMQPLNVRAPSKLVEVRPLYARWGFWTAVGVVSGVGVATALILPGVLEPPPEEAGDVVVVLP